MRTLTILLAVVSFGALRWDGDPDETKRRLRLVAEPIIREVKPPSARVGEKVKIEGANFGTMPVVTFNGVRASVIKVEEDEIRVIVPTGATSGPLVILVGDHASAPVHFVVKGTSAQPVPTQPQASHDTSGTRSSQPASGAPVSFSRDIQPIFDRSCTDCHGGSAGMFLDEGESYANLVSVPATKGCTSEMRVQPGNAEASVLYKRLAGTSCGTQMPKKAPPLPADELALIRRWIESGAPNN